MTGREHQPSDDQLDDWLARAAAPLAAESLPEGILTDAGESTGQRSWVTIALATSGGLAAVMVAAALSGLLMEAPASSEAPSQRVPLATSGSPAPTETPLAASTTPGPTPMAWLRRVEDPGLQTGVPSVAVWDGQRYVGGGLRCLDDPLGSCATALWDSSDGTNWTLQTEMPDAPDVTMQALAIGPLGWVAFAGTAAWYSADGRSWETVDNAPFLEGLADGGPEYQFEGPCCGATVDAVVASEDGYLAVGGVECYKCAGRAAVWRSPDGLTWTRVAYVPQFEGARMRSLVRLEGGRLVAVGGAAWTSDDGGRTWSRHDATFQDAEAHAMLRTESGLVAVGGRTETIQGVIWRSTDGVHWLRTDPPGLAGVEPYALATSHDGVYLSGDLGDRWGIFEEVAGSWSRVSIGPDDAGMSFLLAVGDDAIGLWRSDSGAGSLVWEQ